MKYKSQKNKVNKYTLREMKRKKMEDAMKGDGQFLFVNNTRGELSLMKKPIRGMNPVPPGQTFVGDSYFFNLMRTGDVRLIETIVPSAVKEEIMPEKKLLLNQPDRFTDKGKTEHVVPGDKSVNTLNENQPKSAPPKSDVLLTEDPLDGVEIIFG